MTRFKQWKSVGKTYQEQALIWAFCQCRDSKEVSPKVREKIARLIREAGGEYAAALEAYLCTDSSWEYVVTHYAISDRTLFRVTAKFLELW